MQAWLTNLYYKLCKSRAGFTDRWLNIEDDKLAKYSYSERGRKGDGKATLVFIHGFSSSKETWLPILKHIGDDYHCIIVDLPGHGGTTGLGEEVYTIEKFAERLKQFVDKKGLTDPLCLVGTSLGAAVVSIFALKYPESVKMVSLIAPPAPEETETELLQKVRNGEYSCLLPETSDGLFHIINVLSVKKVALPSFILNGYLHLRLRRLDEHKKILSSLLQHDFPILGALYQQLKGIQCPTLVLWGQQDRFFTAKCADYVCGIILHAEKEIFENCGHFFDIDKPKQTAKRIIKFVDKHHTAKAESSVPSTTNIVN